ncbi:hypothetical protein [Sinorhizobium sp. M4_45]|uniref:hypothetical protein n=1 Tax=Sinorhizobium sp. M4_45 TaxID=2037901 RepID=UPI000C9A8497|nr:hypothetical protein [Sinorhizobium sp. M4_45]PND25949.1 hypothetical protein CN933_17185 [Sinorhizobium sp. M4_45]
MIVENPTASAEPAGRAIWATLLSAEAQRREKSGNENRLLRQPPGDIDVFITPGGRMLLVGRPPEADAEFDGPRLLGSELQCGIPSDPSGLKSGETGKVKDTS